MHKVYLLFLQHIKEKLKITVHDFEESNISAADIFNILAGPFSVCGPFKPFCVKN